MDRIKVEVEDDLSPTNFCFLCLQQLTFFYVEQINPLNFFFTYLKISDKLNSVVCEKCGENLRRFEKLYNNLEKIRLEMDYLLTFIQSTISYSNKNFEPVYAIFASVRKSIMNKCAEKICNPKPELMLKRIHLPKIIPDDSFDDWSPNFDNDSESSISTEFNRHHGSPATPVIDEIKNIKIETYFQYNSTTNKRHEKRKNFASNVRAQCPKCPKIIYKRNLKRHVDLVHLHQLPFKCSTSKKTFHKNASLRRHKKTANFHRGLFKCSTCAKEFGSNSQLRRHKEAVHVRGDVEQIICREAKVILQRLDLSNYPIKPEGQPLTSNSSDKVKSFPKNVKAKCPTCSKVFSSKPNLKQHINAIHLRLKPYKCNICDRSFARLVDLKYHKALPHKLKLEVTPDSKFVFCKVCKKPFPTQAKLQLHNYNVHKNNRFACHICEKIFKSRPVLSRHIGSVHEERRYRCQVDNCLKSYSQPYSLLIHRRLRHPGVFKTPETSFYYEYLEEGKSVFGCNICRSKFQSSSVVWPGPTEDDLQYT